MAHFESNGCRWLIRLCCIGAPSTATHPLQPLLAFRRLCSAPQPPTRSPCRWPDSKRLLVEPQSIRPTPHRCTAAASAAAAAAGHSSPPIVSMSMRAPAPVAVSLNEESVPVTAALFVYMLLPSALLFLGALLTSLLLSNLALSYSCHQNVWAFLWGCVLLFYVWVFYHFFVLFGPRGWTNLTSKLALFALLAVALGLWLAFGHLTLRDHVDGECVRTHSPTHTLDGDSRHGP